MKLTKPTIGANDIPIATTVTDMSAQKHISPYVMFDVLHLEEYMKQTVS